MSEEVAAADDVQEHTQGGLGSQTWLWVLGLAGMIAGIATLASDGEPSLGAAFITVGGLGMLLALTVQSIRAALRS